MFPFGLKVLAQIRGRERRCSFGELVIQDSPCFVSWRTTASLRTDRADRGGHKSDLDTFAKTIPQKELAIVQGVGCDAMDCRLGLHSDKNNIFRVVGTAANLEQLRGEKNTLAIRTSGSGT